MGHSYTVERAYARGDALKKRAAIMQSWANFCPAGGWRQGGAYAKGRGMSRKAIPADDPYSAGRSRKTITAMVNSFVMKKIRPLA
jgi:hypothetical protein